MSHILPLELGMVHSFTVVVPIVCFGLPWLGLIQPKSRLREVTNSSPLAAVQRLQKGINRSDGRIKVHSLFVLVNLLNFAIYNRLKSQREKDQPGWLLLAATNYV